MTTNKLPRAVKEEIKAEFKLQRDLYVSDYLETHLKDTFVISDFYPVILTKLQTAILDGYEIADFSRQPFYNIGEAAMCVTFNRKQEEIEADRSALIVEAESQLMDSLKAKASALYAQITADIERPQHEQEAAERAAEQEARTFESRLRVALSDSAK